MFNKILMRAVLMRVILLGGVAFIAVSCDTVSEQQCQTLNWANKGYSDGASGKTRSALSSHIQACSKYGMNVDTSLYLEGYKKGISQYCTYDTGFSLSEQGNSYVSVCSGSLASEFRRGYEDGARRYCSYDRGFDQGEDGASSKAMCDGSGMEGYRRGYADGHRRHEYEREYDDMRDAQRNYDNMVTRLKDNSLSRDERRRLEKKLRRFKDQLKDAKWGSRRSGRRRHY